MQKSYQNYTKYFRDFIGANWQIILCVTRQGIPVGTQYLKYVEKL